MKEKQKMIEKKESLRTNDTVSSNLTCECKEHQKEKRVRE